MPEVILDEKGCRGCTLCVDICPVQVFEFLNERPVAKVVRPEDCIGCLSCFYACPSQCIQVTNVELLRPFHRMEANSSLIEHFIQAGSGVKPLTDEDYEEAGKDISVRLMALTQTVTETMGRAQKAVGRTAGGVAAEHLPEMYEESSIEDTLKRMQERFAGSFDFTFALEGNEIRLRFTSCGLSSVVTGFGESLNESVLCRIFHEYWAGLLSSFTGERLKVEVPEAGQQCLMVITRAME